MVIYYNEKYYSDIEELSEDLFPNEEEIINLDDDYKLEVYDTIEKPITKLSAEWMVENMDEECWPDEDNDSCYNRVKKIFSENIDFDKINSLLPKLWWPDKKYYLTKKDFLETIS